MSATETRMALAYAEQRAASFVEMIGGACERVAIAGSIRRRAATVGDIEIIAVPKIERVDTVDMFDQVVSTHSVDVLDELLARLEAVETVRKRTTNGHGAWGPKYKRLSFEEAPFDLFACDAQRFGVILAIRTGPAAYSHRLATSKGQKVRCGWQTGLLPPHLRVTDGWLTYRVSGQRIPTPEEQDFYREIGQPYVAPEHRR